MRSVAPDRPVDPWIVAVLRRLSSVVQELGLTYFVTGATARDILLTGVFGRRMARMTRDVDLAIAVEQWSQFERIKSRLLEMDALWSASRRSAQRLFWLIDGVEHQVDIIPFGGVEDPPFSVAWPPDREEVLNVAGYREVFAAAVQVEIEPGFTVPVASLPGLAVLKLFAWKDRGITDPRDALDFATLVKEYADADNYSRLYDGDVRLLEAVAYDIDLAGARLLGQDVRTMTSSVTRRHLLALLEDPVHFDSLAVDMSRDSRATDDAIAEAKTRLRQFKTGLEQE
jgi:predicted nucleotidyltransferase